MKVLLKLGKTGVAFLFALLLVFCMPVHTLALPAVDMGRQGSITIHESYAETDSGVSLSGINFTIYKVANLLKSERYQLTAEFSGSGLQLDHLTTASAVSAGSQQLIRYISEKKIRGICKPTDEKGTVKFKGLTLGYYLVLQNDLQKDRNYAICSPFIVSVPMENSSGNGWIYDIVANAKCEAACGAVILQKENNSGKALSGAVFCLERKVYYSDTAEKPSGAQTGSDSGGNYFWETTVSALTTNRYGQIMVKGMPFGKYRFIETSAPSGYYRNSTPCPFTIATAGSVSLAGGKYIEASGTVQTLTVYNSSKPHTPPHTPPKDSESPPDSHPSTVNSEVVSGLKVPTAPPVSSEVIPDEPVPKSGFDLPKTGGSVCYAVCTYGGEILMLCGAVIFILSRKKKK